MDCIPPSPLELLFHRAWVNHLVVDIRTAGRIPGLIGMFVMTLAPGEPFDIIHRNFLIECLDRCYPLRL